jgi:ABC-type multidrug transport system fused ATPase/permease subunit
LFLDKKIEITVSSFRLSKSTGNLDYSKHKIFDNLSIILFLLTLILVFFNWRYALFIFLLVLLLKFISYLIKKNTVKNFNSKLYKTLEVNIDDGIETIFINYCAGIISLSTIKATAFIPILPSTCISGKIVYAKNRD